jgi:glycosyltransferase involved in cell wall biosynthesis
MYYENDFIVTIGLPVRADLVYFQDAIKSIYAQTIENWLLIIICDDATQEIIEFVRDLNDPRTELVVDTENKGLPYRLNQIASMAKTRYLARMDADDIMMPTRLEKQINFMERNLKLDVLGTSNYLIDEESKLVGNYNEPAFDNNPTSFLKNGIFSHPSVLMRTSWAQKNLYDPSWIRTEDKELWLRTFDESTFHRLDERLMCIRVPRKVDLDKFLITAHFNRKLIWNLGTKVSSRKMLVIIVFANFFKEIIFRFMKKLKLNSFIYKKKYSFIQENERIAAERQLLEIKKFDLPLHSNNQKSGN